MTAATRHAPANDLELSITRIFDAPRELVFSMWSKPEHLSRWSRPHGFTIPDAEMDFRPGGAWRAHMRSAQGEDFRLVGTYREIVKNRRIVFSHAWVEDGKPGHEKLVTVTFADDGAKTRMTFHQAVFESAASRDGHAGGWAECFERLADCISREMAR